MAERPLEDSSFVVLATVQWRGSWLTEQNLAAALARRRRVVYVEPPVTPLTPVRMRSRAELRSLSDRRVRRTSEGVDVVRPVALPFQRLPRLRAASARLVRRQIAAAARAARIRPPVVVVDALSYPGLAGAVGERARVALVKDLLSAGGHLLGRGAETLDDELAAQLGAADVVLATSEALVAELSTRHPRVELLRHGFHAELAPLYDAAPPADLAALPRPRLGFAGTIDDRLDFPALERLADAFAHGALVLVGPISPRLPGDRLEGLRRRPNVALLGPRRRTELPPYLAHLDCCLLPARETAWGRHASPLKLWDYFYAGPPIVGAGYGSLDAYPPPLVHRATGEDLPEAVARALADPAAGRAERRALALANTWDARARRLEHLVDALLSETASFPRV